MPAAGAARVGRQSLAGWARGQRRKSTPHPLMKTWNAAIPTFRVSMKNSLGFTSFARCLLRGGPSARHGRPSPREAPQPGGRPAAASHALNHTHVSLGPHVVRVVIRATRKRGLGQAEVERLAYITVGGHGGPRSADGGQRRPEALARRRLADAVEEWHRPVLRQPLEKKVESNVYIFLKNNFDERLHGKTQTATSFTRQ